MHSQRAPVAFRENLEVTASLRGFDDAECEFLPGHWKVDLVVTGHLQEYTRVRTAFVGLSGGMQEARPESETGSDALFIADCNSHALQRVRMWVVHLYVGEQPEVIARAEPFEMSP